MIDELHSFLGNVRGVHLASLLSRLHAMRLVDCREWLGCRQPCRIRKSQVDSYRPEVRFQSRAYPIRTKGGKFGLHSRDCSGCPIRDEREERAIRRTPDEALNFVKALSVGNCVQPEGSELGSIERGQGANGRRYR